jgi:CRP-like cAMP-binding protein
MDLIRELARYGQIITVRENRAFYYQDDPCAAALYLVQGSVRPVKFASDGKPFDLPVISAGQWFGLAELLTARTCLFDAVAAEECRALSFSKANLELALKDGLASRTILSALADEIARLHRLLADDDALGKILSYLLARRGNGQSIIARSCLRVTQGAVADSLALTRETVNRQLKELESLGIVTTGRGEIGIPDWDALAVFAKERSR